MIIIGNNSILNRIYDSEASTTFLMTERLHASKIASKFTISLLLFNKSCDDKLPFRIGFNEVGVAHEICDWRAINET